MRMEKELHGIVRGKTIDLTEEPGVADGLEVKVVIKPTEPGMTWGDGLRRCAGALADDWTPEDDQILDEIYKDRKNDVRRDPGE